MKKTEPHPPVNITIEKWCLTLFHDGTLKEKVPKSQRRSPLWQHTVLSGSKNTMLLVHHYLYSKPTFLWNNFSLFHVWSENSIFVLLGKRFRFWQNSASVLYNVQFREKMYMAGNRFTLMRWRNYPSLPKDGH